MATLARDAVVIEDYPAHWLGACCLVLAHLADERSLHAVIGHAHEPWTIVTVYLPDPAAWNEDFTERRRQAVTCNCGCDMHRVRIEFLGRWGRAGERVLVTDVPAWECERCGMRTMDADIAAQAERLVRGQGSPGHMEPRTVRAFAHADA